MSPPPRILISINTSWNIYNFRKRLIEALQEAGYEVISAAPEDDYTPRLLELCDSHVNLPMSNAGTSPPQDFLLFCRYVQLLRQLRPDVMLGYTIKPNVYGALAGGLVGVPVINNVSGLGTAFIRDTWVTKVVKTLYRQAFRFSSCVFFQNPEDRDLFLRLKLVAPEKTALLPGSGVDLEHFHPAENKPSPSEGEGVTFILIARMLRDKGVEEFVEAARIVRRRHPDARFRLLGPTGIENQTSISRDTIDAWVKEGVVEYLGETDDVRGPVWAHDCVVLPSYREGMSRVLLEAAAMGRPLIATDVPGCRHVVDDGVNGLLCEVRHAEDLAEKMLSFIGLTVEEREAMGRASRAKAEREFDEKLVIGAYLERIAKLVKRRQKI